MKFRIRANDTGCIEHFSSECTQSTYDCFNEYCQIRILHWFIRFTLTLFRVLCVTRHNDEAAAFTLFFPLVEWFIPWLGLQKWKAIFWQICSDPSVIYAISLHVFFLSKWFPNYDKVQKYRNLKIIWTEKNVKTHSINLWRVRTYLSKHGGRCVRFFSVIRRGVHPGVCSSREP